MNVACVILAAGGSTRLGSPKQLLDYGGRSLLRHAAAMALATTCRPVVVVLGSGAERLRSELVGLDLRIVDNPDWGNGMGSSVRAGVATLRDGASGTDPEAILLMLCDQPLIGAEALEQLVAAFRAGQTAGDGRACSIAAAAYGDGSDTVGVPAVFGREYFAELAALPDQAGARPVLQRHAGRVAAVPMPEAVTDIDTREQYERLPK